MRGTWSGMVGRPPQAGKSGIGTRQASYLATQGEQLMAQNGDLKVLGVTPVGADEQLQKAWKIT